MFVNGSSTGVLALAAPFYAKDFYRVRPLECGALTPSVSTSNLLLLILPIQQAEAARGLFWRLKQRGHVVVGLSSYRFFPQPSDDPGEDRMVTTEDAEVYEAMDGWLHCSRDPDDVLPKGVPRILWSESDISDPFMGEGDVHRVSPGIFGARAAEHPTLVPRKPGTVRKAYDLIYR